MCVGRIAQAFRVAQGLNKLVLGPDDYNVAPTTFQPVLRQNREGQREITLMRWGLIPFFTKQLADIKGISTINARAESVNTSPNWREPFNFAQIATVTGHPVEIFSGVGDQAAFVLIFGVVCTLQACRAHLKHT